MSKKKDERKKEKKSKIFRDKENNTFIHEKDDKTRICMINVSSGGANANAFGFGGGFNKTNRPKMNCGGKPKGRKQAEEETLKFYQAELKKDTHEKKKV